MIAPTTTGRGPACNGPGTDPELWFPIGEQADECARAVGICRGCPVRLRCARRAIDTGERHAVMAGFRCWVASERDALRAWEAAETEAQAVNFTDLVPVAAHVRALRAAGMSYRRIAIHSDTSHKVIAALAAGNTISPDHPGRISRALADRIHRIEVTETAGEQGKVA